MGRRWLRCIGGPSRWLPCRRRPCPQQPRERALGAPRRRREAGWPPAAGTTHRCPAALVGDRRRSPAAWRAFGPWRACPTLQPPHRLKLPAAQCLPSNLLLRPWTSPQFDHAMTAATMSAALAGAPHRPEPLLDENEDRYCMFPGGCGVGCRWKGWAAACSAARWRRCAAAEARFTACRACRREDSTTALPPTCDCRHQPSSAHSQAEPRVERVQESRGGGRPAACMCWHGRPAGRWPACEQPAACALVHPIAHLKAHRIPSTLLPDRFLDGGGH